MKLKDIYMYILGSVVVLGVLGITVYLIATGKYESTIQLLVGCLISAFSTVVGYFYGSSKSSSDKNEMIKNGKS